MCVDDFSIKYWSKEDAEHLCNAIGASHWNYKLGYVDISILKAILSILKKLNHILKVSPQYSLHHHIPIQYSRRDIQQMTNNVQSLLLPKDKIKIIQLITGSFFYYARELDWTMLAALNEIACAQASPTEYSKKECK